MPYQSIQSGFHIIRTSIPVAIYKVCVMRQILHAKEDCNPRFRDGLINSEGKRFSGNQASPLLGSGLSPIYAISGMAYFKSGKI